MHVVIGMSRWVAVQALCTQGCGSHLRTPCLVTMAKYTAAKETKEAQLLSFLQPQSVADHMRRGGILKEHYSFIGSC